MKKSWLVVLACVAGCGDANAGPRWSGVVDTLPGGTVRVTNTDAGMWSVDEIWRLVPELRIGSAGEDSATMFASVSAIAAGADGRIYVLDRQLNELRIFDSSGALVRRVGRSGEGPGEFESANGLQWVGDSLLVVDGDGGRYSMFDRDGNFGRTMLRPISSYGWRYEGALISEMLYESGGVLVGDEYRSAIQGMRLTDQPVVLDTVFLPSVAAPTIESYSVQNERGGMFMSVPFAPMYMWRLSADGRLWYGNSGDYRIFQGTLDGDTLMEIVGVSTRAAVTQGEIDEWAAGDSPRDFKARGGDLDLSRIPKEKPYFRDFFIDPERNLWVELELTDEGSAFDIFDPDGRYLGRVATDVRRDRYVFPVVRDGKLYVVGLDDMDVPYVHVLRIEKGAISPQS